MKKLATKLTPAIKAWIEKEFGCDWHESFPGYDFFNFPNYKDFDGYRFGCHSSSYLLKGYTEVSEQEFLAEFAKPKFDNTERIVEVRDSDSEKWRKRVLLMFKNGKIITWANAETIEEAKEIVNTHEWNLWQELPIKEIITKEKAEELLNFKYKIK